MGEPVLWVGGWASGLACWRNDLERLYPGREHAFLDAHALLEEPGLLSVAAEGLPRDGTLAAWSLGSLLVHKALAGGAFRPACRLVSISPIFDFCGEGGTWPRAALMRMARRLPRERESVLAEFWKLVKGESAVTQSQERQWFEQSRRYSLESLLLGLEFLGAAAVDRSGIPFGAGPSYLASPQDPLAPTPRDVFPGGEWSAYARGHLPFLDYPDLLRPLLEAAPARRMA